MKRIEGKMSRNRRNKKERGANVMICPVIMSI